MSTSTAIGDGQEKAVQPMVSALPLGIVAQVDVEDKNNPINNRLYSGKQEGAVLLMTNTSGGNYDIIVAKDSGVTDAWVRISDASAITPS